MIAREAHSFQQVLTKRNASETSADLRVEARIVGFRKARGAAFVASRGARVTAEVAPIDVTTGAVIARFTAERRSAVAVEQAIKRASEQIAAFLEAHMNGSPVPSTRFK